MKTKKKLFAFALALTFALVFAAGCTKPADPLTPTPAASAAPAGDTASLGIRLANGSGYTSVGELERAYINGLNAFTCALVRNMGEGWTGVVSPLSFSIILELLANGADGEGAELLLNSLCTQLGMDATNENAARLLTALEKSVRDVAGAGADQARREGGTNSAVKLNLLTAIIVGANDKFSEDFEHTAADYYDASIGMLDFTDNQAALEAINGWVSNGTNGLIPTLFDSIPSDTSMTLLNALYFNASWETPFVAFRDETGSGAGNIFHGANGDSAATMLRATNAYLYGDFGGDQVVLVPYAGGEFYMAVILPAEGRSPADAMASVIDRLGDCEKATVALSMPAVQLSTKFDAMNDMLPALGLEGVVNGSIQFPGIVEASAIRLTQFVHAAVLNVTAEGTEAAAATGATGTKNAAPIDQPDYTVNCDRPYAMAIVHASTGAVIFASTVHNIPSGANPGGMR